MPNKYHKCLVIDTEIDNNQIIEIGVGHIDFKENSLSRFQSWLIRPVGFISPEIEALTGITNSLLQKKGKPLREVFNTISKQYSSRIPYSGWGNDHKPFSLMISPPSPFSDEYINWGHIFNFKHKINKRTSLDKALGLYGLSFEGQRHRAKDDAYNCGRLAIQLMENYCGIK